jgi:hypothetical protein
MGDSREQKNTDLSREDRASGFFWFEMKYRFLNLKAVYFGNYKESSKSYRKL